MPLLRLELTDFRCFEAEAIELDPQCTVIAGANASGKTSLLEAISLLSTGRSFRQAKVGPLIRRGAERFLLVGRISGGQGEVLGVQADATGLSARMNARSVSFAEVAAALPVQVIDPDVHQLIEGGPVRRRRFLDSGLFHVEPTFLAAWRTYQRALKQRNAALRAKLSAVTVRTWDQSLLKAGDEVTRFRMAYCESVSAAARDVGIKLLGLSPAVSYQQGWRADHTFEEALERSWTRDLQSGTTMVGPHRADFTVSFDSAAQVRQHYSRGQHKMLACTLLLAQQRIAANTPTHQCLLLDDPAAELDVDNLGKLLGVIRELSSQLVVTALEAASVAQLNPRRMFHVERGNITQML